MNSLVSVDSAMGHIPRSIERISSCLMFFITFFERTVNYQHHVCECEMEMERIARQNLEAELQRTLAKLTSVTASCDSLQQTELVRRLYPNYLVLLVSS